MNRSFFAHPEWWAGFLLGLVLSFWAIDTGMHEARSTANPIPQTTRLP